MAVDPLPAALRRDRIAALVQDRGFIRVAELSRIFRTSPVTIRTDLDELVSRGLVRRVHGGAVPTAAAATPAIARDAGGDTDEWALIGAAAAEHIKAGQTVVLASSPGTRLVARALATRNELEDVTVLTNDLHIALELQPAHPHLRIIVTGGTLQPGSPELGDPLGSVLLTNIRADLSIVGCGAISAGRGVSETDIARVEVARRLFGAGDRTIVVADAAQVGASSPARVADSEEVDLLVTSVAADPSELAQLRDRDVEVESVPD